MTRAFRIDERLYESDLRGCRMLDIRERLGKCMAQLSRKTKILSGSSAFALCAKDFGAHSEGCQRFLLICTVAVREQTTLTACPSDSLTDSEQLT